MTGRTILVTGAGRDIGRKIAERLVKNAPKDDKPFVFLHCAASRTGAEQVLEQMVQNGGDGVVVQADLRTSEGVEHLFTTVIETLAGRQLNIFVSNAAIAAATPIGQTESANVQAMTRVNLQAPFELVNRLAPHMATGGSIIALSVAATHKVFSPDFAYFSATKAAVDCLVQHWAVAFGERQIRVNAIAPGVIEANFRAQLVKDDAFRAQLESDTALGRAGQIDDVVKVVEFLTSAQAGWITGQVIDVSGGWRL